MVAVFILVTISMVTSIQAKDIIEKKESPLYKIRSEQAIKNSLNRLKEIIHTRFLNGRLFLNIQHPIFFRCQQLEDSGTHTNHFTDCEQCTNMGYPCK